MTITRASSKEEIRKHLEATTDLRFGQGIDFFATRLSDRPALVEAAKAKGYRHADTGGSAGRYFYEYLEKP
jgi:hypothetical protein